MRDEDQENHPAYGMVRIGRVRGGGTRFFGSSVIPQDYITIEIHEGEVSRSLGQEWYGKGKIVTSLKLTPAQFSELITTTNGSGVPCTLDIVNGKRREDIPDDKTTPVEEAQIYQEEQLSKFADRLEKNEARIEELFNKKVLSASDKKELKAHLQDIHREVRGNMPFYTEQFKRANDKIVEEAKIEMDAFATNYISKLGMKALKSEIKEGKPLLGIAALEKKENSEKGVE